MGSASFATAILLLIKQHSKGHGGKLLALECYLLHDSRSEKSLRLGANQTMELGPFGWTQPCASCNQLLKGQCQSKIFVFSCCTAFWANSQELAQLIHRKAKLKVTVYFCWEDTSPSFRRQGLQRGFSDGFWSQGAQIGIPALSLSHCMILEKIFTYCRTQSMGTEIVATLWDSMSSCMLSAKRVTPTQYYLLFPITAVRFFALC